MNTLPELAFEKFLSHLSLEDLIRSRAVSRYWRDSIDHLCKATCLCYSGLQRDQIWDQLIARSPKFDRNFISSYKFNSFFGYFAKSILSNLKHFRLQSVALERGLPLFQTINSFGRLEELDLINVEIRVYAAHHRLNLPNLKRIEINGLREIKKLTILNSPKLSEIRIRFYRNYIQLDIVHVESVERIDIDRLDGLQVEKFKNLKYLSLDLIFVENDLFLSKLERLEEIHLTQKGLRIVWNQKESFKLHNLKVFYCGLPLNDLTDLRGFLDNYMNYSDHYYSSRYSLTERQFSYYVENHSRLDDEIPVYECFDYSAIDMAIPKMPMDFWKRFTNLREIRVNKPIPVKAIRPFLKFLKGFENIETLEFGEGQLQKLFDQLPDHCDLRRLKISGNETLSLKFLLRLKHITEIWLSHWIRKPDFLRCVFSELEFISEFAFVDRFGTRTRVTKLQSQQFRVSGKVYNDLNFAIAGLNLA